MVSEREIESDRMFNQMLLTDAEKAFMDRVWPKLQNGCYRTHGSIPVEIRGLNFNEFVRDGLCAVLSAAPQPSGPVEVLDTPIAKGLLSDEDAKAAGLGRFGHHPNPAIDFEIEVESLQSRLFDAKHGISKPGTAVESIVAVLEDIQRAMLFRVGGDEGAVKAKQLLCQLENEALSALTSSKPEQVPSGWKLVPEEPTEEMYRAVYKVQDDCAIHNYGASPTFDDYWSAALSASPAAPTAGGGDE